MNDNKSLVYISNKLPERKVRVCTASDPMAFAAIISGIVASVIMADVTALLVAVSAATGAVAAAPYVPFLYRRALYREQRKNHRMARIKRRATERRVLRELPPTLCERYLELKVRVRDVPKTFASDDADTVLDQVQGQLRDLLMAYLRLLTALHNLDRMLANVDEIDLYRQLDQLNHEISIASPKLAAVKTSRREILLRRKARIEAAREHREIVITQLEMVEDVVSLLRDATLTVHDPVHLNQQLSDLMMQIEAADEAVAEMTFPENELEELAHFEERIEERIAG